MDKASRKNCLTSDLVQEFAGYRMTVSPLIPGFHFEEVLADAIECSVVKENNRRQVYHLQTTAGGYYLKRSSLVRPKDRWRHFLLPRRRWAEWRNLHRLRQARVPAARPLVKGQPQNRLPQSYFILTEQVVGTHMPLNSLQDARSMGQYAAFLHRHRIYHADLNRHNFILNPEGQHYLLDAQEIYFLPWLPQRLRINNLGRIVFNLCSLDDSELWVAEFLEGYNNLTLSKKAHAAEVIDAARRHQARRLRSRSKRCCKNSSEFEVLKSRNLRGYKRRSFGWQAPDLQQASEQGKPLKGAHVTGYQGVCLKMHRRSYFHLDRCKTSWKMSRALEVRGIAVPRALGYFLVKGQAYFLSELMRDSLHLNDYLSTISERRQKQRALRKLALWLRTIHDKGVWQRDFKSDNILCRQGNYYMIDLDGVRTRPLKDRDRITNLAQLNASLSNAITLKDRLRFFHHYLVDERMSREQRRKWYKEIWDITKTKGTFQYGLDLAVLVKINRCAADDKKNKPLKEVIS